MGRIAGHAIGARQRNDGRPIFLAHFVTHRCHCKCASCLWHHDDWQDVPLEDLKRFYGEARDQGFVGVGISGGEPFMRKDLGELTRFAKHECGLALLMITTGWHLRIRGHEVLPNLDVLVLSLDSAKAERHDAIRGVPGLFDRAIEGAKRAKQDYPHLAIHFNCCVQRDVAGEIDDLIELARETGIGISFDVITPYRHGEGDAHFTENDCSLPMDELRAVAAKLVERKRAGAPIMNSERYFQYFADGAPGYRCHFPKLCMSVDGRGNVEDCLNLHRPLGNVRDSSLADIMAGDRFRELRKACESCCSCNSPTMVDMSHVWEHPNLILAPGGISLGAHG
jgi:MoaA/NifB/PqqE/SkfB family radical SAM enzyme